MMLVLLAAAVREDYLDLPLKMASGINSRGTDRLT